MIFDAGFRYRRNVIDPGSSRRWIRLTAKTVTAVWICSLVGGCSTDSSTSLQGAITVYSTEVTGLNVGSQCTGSSESLAAGDQLVIKDQRDETIGLGDLRSGTVVNGSGCRLPFTVEDLPQATFYVIVPTDGLTDPYRLSAQELVTAGWRVSLQVGTPIPEFNDREAPSLVAKCNPLKHPESVVDVVLSGVDGPNPLPADTSGSIKSYDAEVKVSNTDYRPLKVTIQVGWKTIMGWLATSPQDETFVLGIGRSRTVSFEDIYGAPETGRMIARVKTAKPCV